MDNGEVIPGLDEDWNFGGANIAEWMAGLVAFIMVQEIFLAGQKIGRAMPLLMMVWVITTLSLAMLRRRFPDQHRGLRNHLMTVMGFAPPGIPAPASLQPYWSGCRMQKLPEQSKLLILKLDEAWELERTQPSEQRS
jgi:hypothetical protein